MIDRLIWFDCELLFGGLVCVHACVRACVRAFSFFLRRRSVFVISLLVICTFVVVVVVVANGERSTTRTIIPMHEPVSSKPVSSKQARLRTHARTHARTHTRHKQTPIVAHRSDGSQERTCADGRSVACVGRVCCGCASLYPSAVSWRSALFGCVAGGPIVPARVACVRSPT